MNRNESFEALHLTRLVVHLTNATLEICTDDIDRVQVMVAGNENEVEALRIAMPSDTLTIEQKIASTAKSAAVSSSWMQITLRLPRSWKGRMEARTVTGWMNLRGLKGSDLDLDTVSGMISGADLDFLTLSALTVLGDVKLIGVSCEKCSLSTTSGEMTAQGMACKTCSAITVTGAVKLVLSAPFEDISLNAVTGDLCVDAPIDTVDVTMRSVSGRAHLDGVTQQKGAPRIKATTVSSDLDVAQSNND